MATPALTGLPTELLDKIIPHVLPEGFESLALTCRTIYELCTPFIQRHNHLSSQFQKFRYREISRDPSLSPIRTAFDLITRIAIEPMVARYIKDADFNRDSFPPRARLPQLVPDVHRGGPVVTLLADSPYIGQAGLDWTEYYALIEEDLKQDRRYSQHAAAFLLTLLPNVKTLTLPRLWKPLDNTEKLLDVIVRQTKHPHFPWDKPSLAQVTRFESFSSLGAGHRFDLHKAVPFLALPRIRSFRGPSCVAIGDASLALLKLFISTLTYSHSTRGGGDHQDWNICKFVTAIEREAASCLEELSISIHELRGSITPGKASMRGFQRLRKLEFPLEITMCNVTNALSRVATVATLKESLTDQGLGKFEPFIGDLVPASVSQLSLLSRGTDHHEKALEVMFRDFATNKNSQLPALKEIHLSCPISPSADDAYKEECIKLVAETEEAGVVLHLEEWPCSITMTWDGA